MTLKVEEWNNSYINKDNFVFYPHEEIIRFAAKYIVKKQGLNSYKYIAPQDSKVLDLGCGIGRHIVFFEKMGIDAYGVDLSNEAIKVAKEWCAIEKINHEDKFYCGSAEQLPWADEHFGFIVSHGVLDSMPFNIAQNIVKECHRVLKDESLFYCDLIGDESDVDLTNTLEKIVKSKHEEGTIQSYFTEDKIKLLIGDLFEVVELFKIIKSDELNGKYYSRYHLVLKKLAKREEK